MKYVALLAFLLVACGGGSGNSYTNHMPSGWTAITLGNDYGAKVDPATGSFTFPLAPASVHYVTRECSLANAKGLQLHYRLTAAPTTKFEMMHLVGSVDTPVVGSVAIQPVIYIQRTGDNGSGVGQYEMFRWWATYNPRPPLAPGDYTITAMFDQRWTAIETSNSVDEAPQFKAAIAHVARCGFTFPGMTGEGHGATATGPATFTVVSFGPVE